MNKARSLDDGAVLGPEAVFRSELQNGRILLQQCGECGEHVFYPRVLCPHCGADRLNARVAKGTGTVYSTTIVRQKPDLGGDYNISLIDLTEGVRMMSRVVGIAPSEVRIGLPVRARVETLGDAPAIVFEKA